MSLQIVRLETMFLKQPLSHYRNSKPRLVGDAPFFYRGAGAIPIPIVVKRILTTIGIVLIREG